MVLSSDQIEGIAVNAVASAVYACDALIPHISQNDKTPSWDGFILVYHQNHVHKNENLIGRVPVQIKGISKAFDGIAMSYPFSVADLENYRRDMGCVLFLVSIEPETKANRIFFSSLSTDELGRILSGPGGEKTRSIPMEEFPSDRTEIEQIFKSFLHRRWENPSCLVELDEAFLERYRLQGDEADNLLTEFSNINSDPSLILKIVCNRLHIHTPAYDRLVEKIYAQTIRSQAPAILMADGGTGKSTLLCSVACYAQLRGDHVLYVNWDLAKQTSRDEMIKHLKRFLAATSGTTVFCIDEAMKNQELIQALYRMLAYPNKKSSFGTKLHILIADRTYRIKDLFFNKSYGFSLWTANSPILLIENLEPDDAGAQETVDFLSDYFDPKHITVLYFDKEIRSAIIEKMIGYFSASHHLDPECAEAAKQSIIQNRKTLSDILLDFRRNYNAVADRDSRVHPITKIDWDWDIWRKKLDSAGNVPVPAGKIPLKHTFRYLAALTAAHVDVSIPLLEKMTGIALADELCGLFPVGLSEPVGITRGGFLKLRHETVAANYFEINPRPSPAKCLETLIHLELFDSSTLARFEKEVFSLVKFYSADPIEAKLDINKLLHAFSSHDNFRKILAEKNRLHSLEFALIASEAQAKKNSIVDLASYYENRLNSSFTYALSMLPHHARYYRIANLWLKYFRFAARVCQRVPSALLNYLLYKEHFYKIITKYVKSMLESLMVWIPEDQKHELYSCAAELFQYILDHIDCDDIPSKINLIQIYISQNKLENAHKISLEIANAPRSLLKHDPVLLIIKNYREMVKRQLRIDRNDPQIHVLNQLIVELYEKTRQHYPKDSSMYLSTTCNFARFQKERLLFDPAYELLDELIKNDSDSPIIWRVYVELGMLCNTNSYRNKYYNKESSIRYFTQAWEFLQPIKSEQKKNALYILKPLAQTYMTACQYENAIKICDQILSYYPNEPQVKQIKASAIKSLQTM